MKEKEKIFKLFAHNIPVKGARRSTVCDLQRGEYHFIPNTLYELLTIHKNQSIGSIKSKYDSDHHPVIDEYFDFLFEKELGYFTHHPDYYPDLDLSWRNSSEFTNAIIDISSDSNHPFDRISKEFDQIGVSAVQVRFFDAIDQAKIESVIQTLSKGRILSIDLIIPFEESLTEKEAKRIVSKYQRISYLVIHGAPEQKVVKHDKLSTNIIFMTKKVTDESHCGEINPANFYVNTELFSESQVYNSCLNRKISIDRFGQIKNCPSLIDSFGNIQETTLLEAAQEQKLKKLWNVTKDAVEVCKDCEFRYICTDCRAYTEDNNSNNAKPSKCSYDPYTAEWQESEMFALNRKENE
jgi:SPASM domain peptide maturase of grasp-with-spasm system